MDLGIMQPYFFPYLGYFDVIAKTDRWIVFDVVNYHARHWMNRNRILEPVKGEQYITVPVGKSSDKRLDKIKIKDLDAALDKILGQLRSYYKKAPFYDDVINLVKTAFQDCPSDLLRDLNIQTIQQSCARIDLSFNYQIASEMDLDFSSVSHPGQWALEICDQVSAQSYLNPPGGRDIFKIDEWVERNIFLHFTKMPEFVYETHPKFSFRPHLSILDVMMWNKPEIIHCYLQDLEIAE